MSRIFVIVLMLGLPFTAAHAQQPVQPAAYDARPESAEAEKPVDVPVDQLGKQFRLIGKLKLPLGEVAKVQGIVVKGPGEGYESGMNVRVYRINGAATQEFIQLKLNDFFGRDEIPNLESGKAFEFEGYESGGFVGVPAAANKKAGVAAQTADHHFLHELTVFDQTEIKLQPFSPADFVGREALIQGKAVSDGGSAYVGGDGWRLLVDNGTPWPRAAEGKVVEARGSIRTLGNKTNTYRLDKATKGVHARLVQLSDQVGKQVVLRGSLVSRGTTSIFRYRGTDVYIEGVTKLASKLESGTSTVEVTGLLEEGPVQTGTLDSLNGEKIVHRGYIIRKAALKPVETLLAIERAEPVE